MLRRILIGMFLGLAVMFSSVGFMPAEAFPKAGTQLDQVALGGIPLGATMDAVKAVYGEPAAREQAATGGPDGNSIIFNDVVYIFPMAR